MARRGVVIGKFYPPHRGHQYLIDTARSQVDALTVIICARPDQTIPGDLRAAWLRELYPAVTVLVVPDALPADDSQAWAATTVGWLGAPPDVVFTSERYGDAYARWMGCQHVLVDLARAHVPVSGTAVRRDPLAHWDDLAPGARAHYAKRICVVGAESTGTTTLAEHYRTAWVPEYGRLYWEARQHTPAAERWETAEFVHIATEQCRLEDALARRCNRLLVCDTEAFATGIWHERYVGARSPAVEAIGANRRYDLYVLTDVDIPFVQDGTRDGAHLRQWMHTRFVAALRTRGQPWALVSGSRTVRLATATRLIDAILGAPPADAPRSGSAETAGSPQAEPPRRSPAPPKPLPRRWTGRRPPR